MKKDAHAFKKIIVFLSFAMHAGGIPLAPVFFGDCEEEDLSLLFTRVGIWKEARRRRKEERLG